MILPDIRIRLRIGIVSIFTLLVVPLTGLMIGILYYQNANLARETARTAMVRATGDVVEALRTTLQPLASAVDMSIAFGQVQGLELTHPEAWFPLFSALEMSRDAYSLYYGFSHGEFLQIVRLPPDIAKFGPLGAKPPAEARYVVRLIDESSGERSDVYFYMAKWGEVVKIERAPELRYNPRLRPWFKAAREQDGLANSGIYIFSGTGRPGLTLSHRIETEDGGFVGVFGADISLDTLAETLRQNQVGADGRTFLLDEAGKVIAYPDVARAVRNNGDKLSIMTAEEFDDPLVAEAARLRRLPEYGDQFRAPMGPDGHTYLVSFSPMPTELKRPWTIVVIADEEEFVAPIRRVSLTILAVGVGFVMLVSFGVLLASRLLTRPIGQLIAETRNIKNLDLDAPVDVSSPVLELSNLAQALNGMKATLRSFAVYVPKEVVRSIVNSGAESVVGGVRQPLTIMFTDLKGFTTASEQLEPEEVLRRLSRYLDAMSWAIHANGGTIDKFVGDAIMALWNAPQSDPQHEISACRGMLACRDANAALNNEITALGLPPFVTRYGLHSEMAVVGNVGSRDRMQYTALGSGVNLASRVEGLNKVFGTELLVTETVEEEARGHFLFRPFGQVIAAGTSLSIGLFELVDEIESGGEPARRCAVWQLAFDAYSSQNWDEAVRLFESFLTEWPEDQAAHLFHSRSFAFRDQPPANWDGVLVVDSK